MRSRKRNSANFFFDYQESTTTASPTKKFNNSSGSSFPSSKDGPAMGNYDPKYPESFTAFADGLKSDVMELLGTSAGLLNRSINFIFPFMGYDSVETSINDSLHDIEVMNPKSSKTRQQQQQQLQQKQSQDALKLRCQSLWTKENQNSYQITTENSSNSSSHAQKGGKVLLDKLAKNNNIQSYPCGDSDDHLVILGNVRMIVAKKNYDTINSASILWSQPFREIATCAINCTLSGNKSGLSRLDITNRENNIYTIYLKDSTVCVQVMMVIQSRCSTLAQDPNSSSTSSLSPLPIGSSPMTNRLKNKNNQKGKKNKKISSNSSPIQDENCENGVISSPNRHHQSRRLSAMSMSSPCANTPLKELSTESPFKRSRRLSSENMEVVDLLGLSDLPAHPNTSTSHDIFTSSSLNTNPFAQISQSALLKSYLQDYEKSGESLQSIIQRMQSDGVDTLTIQEFQRQYQDLEEEKQKKLKDSEDPFSKYQKMLKSGIPPPAVRHKMTLDGISQSEQDKFFGINSNSSTPLPTPTLPSSSSSSSISTTSTTTQIAPHLRKYQVMLKSGVPTGAVNQKMIQENISQIDRNMVLGIQEEISEKSSNSSGSAAAASTAPAVPSGPKFIGLHWDPIHVNDVHIIQGSIWGEIHTEHEQHSLQLAHEEYSTLSTLFAKKNKSTNESQYDGQEGNETQLQQQQQQEEYLDKKKGLLKRKSSMPTTIDMSRSTNISIGLSSFKQKKMTIEMIIECLTHFDVTQLGQEDLLRLQEILPTENEVKTLQNTAASEADLHETELWLKKLTTIDGVTRKVQAMTFMVTAESTMTCVGDNLSLIGEISGKILSCSGLRDVLKCVLAIGNSMNHGTWKGGAKAIKLASLTKLSQTKSVDGKSTVMDYLVHIMTTRAQNGDIGSSNALNIDEELKPLHIAKNINLTEIIKEIEKLRFQLTNLSKEVSDNQQQLRLHEIQRLQEFISFTDQKITFLEQFLTQVITQTNEIITFFGEEADTPLSQIFGLLAEFLTSFTKSKENLEKKVLMERRKAMTQIRRKSLNSST